MAEAAFDRVEERISQSCRQAHDHAFDDASDRVCIIFRRHDSFFHRRSLRYVEGRQRFVLELAEKGRIFPDRIKGLIMDIGNLQDVRTDGNAPPGQYLHGHGAAKDEGCCEPAREVAAAAEIVIATIAYLTAVIGMARPHHVTQVVVILGMLIAVFNDHTQGGPRRITIEITAFDIKLVAFTASRRHGIPAGRAARHMTPYIIPVDGFPRRKAIQDSPYSRTMGFTEDSELGCLSKGITHDRISFRYDRQGFRSRPKTADRICGHILPL